MAEMLIIWVLAPLGLLLLCYGVGIIFAAVTRLPKTLPENMVVGFLGIVVVGSLVVLDSHLAKYAAYVVAALGVGGLLWAVVQKNLRPKFDILAVFSGLFTYFIFSLPSLSYGKHSWNGWVQLDDNASWYAITNRIMTLGHSIPNPILTTYDRVLQVYLGGNQFNYGGNNGGQFTYPTGSLIPFGSMSQLSRVELAWLFQPYLAFCAGLLAMLFVLILRKNLRKRHHVVLGAVLASCASTYYSYAMWGGIKEIVLVIPVTYFAIAFFISLSKKFEWRNYAHPLLALLAQYFIGEKTSFAFLIPMFVIAVLLLAKDKGRKWLYGAGTGIGFLVTFGMYSLVTKNFLAKMVVPTIVDSGNLYGPLNPLQILGIWPSRDFRVTPVAKPLTFLVIFLALGLVILASVQAVRRGKWLIPALLISTTTVFGFSRAYAGAWLTAKAIAVGSPIFLLACVVGMNELSDFFTNFRLGSPKMIRYTTLSIVIAISGGVITSNVMTYRNVWFAPSEQIDELRNIGHTFAGQGPTLMTEYSPFGARYFLREIGAEAAGELRVHLIPMRDGNGLNKGAAADIDLFDNSSIDYFNLLVLRKSAQGSRPPINYSLAWIGKHYEVWKKNGSSLVVKRTLILGNNFSAGGQPSCAQVKDFLANRSPGEKIFTVPRETTNVISFSQGALPDGWVPSSFAPGGVNFEKSGGISRNFNVEAKKDYQFWLSGSFPGELEVLIDGARFFKGRSVFEGNSSLGNPLGTIQLAPGIHLITVIYKTPSFQAGAQVHATFGPIMFTSQSAGQSQVESVTASGIPSLCQRNLDWIAIAQ